MKRLFALFFMLWVVLGTISLLQSCTSLEPESNTSTSTPSNTQSGKSQVLRPGAPSASCSIQTMTKENLQQICSQISPEVIEYLSGKNLLMVTLRGLKAQNDPNQQTASIQKINEIDVRSNLSQNEAELIAEKVKIKLADDFANISLPGTETQKIADKLKREGNQNFILSLLIPLAAIVALGGFGWFYNRRQFKEIRDEVGRLPKERSGKNGTQDLTQLQTNIEDLGKHIIEQLGENAEYQFTELKDLIASVHTPQINEPEAFVVDLPIEDCQPAAELQSSDRSFLESFIKGGNALSVDELKRRYEESGVVLTINRYGGKYTESIDGTGEIFLIRINPRNGLAIPKYASISKPELFSNYYQKFYERVTGPATGEVWIKRPALFKKSDEGWELESEKGELEIR